MRKLVLIALLVLSGLAYSQESGAVRGTVLDAEMGGEPMLFANVNIINTSLEGETNLHGNFEFTAVAPGTYTLVVSYPGYQELEFPIEVKHNATTHINGVMQAKELRLDGAMMDNKPVSTRQVRSIAGAESASLK